MSVDATAIAAEFNRWTENRRGVSALYEVIVEELIRDRELLLLIAQAGPLSFIQIRFMAAVHFLLLEGNSDALSEYYPTITPNPRSPSEVYPYFRRFCFRHREQLLKVMADRGIQINEPRRCSALLLALSTILQRAGSAPLALVDVGACAGLNLLFDHYRYDFGHLGAVGEASAPLEIKCELRGSKPPNLPTEFPKVTWRRGIDLCPVDVTDRHQINWLIANVSPDDHLRLARLKASLALAQLHRPIVIRGNASVLIKDVLSEIPKEMLACVFHSFTIHHFTPKELEEFQAMLSEFGCRRILYVISLEWERGKPGQTNWQPAFLKLAVLNNGLLREETLAKADSRGSCAWLEWR